MIVKEWLGMASVVLSVANLSLYIRTVFVGRTKPHAFSWLVWAITMGIIFFAQFLNSAGAGSWQTGEAAVFCAAIGILALFKGEKKITRTDWAALFSSLSAIPLWIITKDPLASVILLTVIDAVAFYPTFRKSYNAPFEEDMPWAFRGGAVFTLSTLALENYSLTTVFYPFVMIIIHTGLGIMLIIRRRQKYPNKST